MSDTRHGLTGVPPIRSNWNLDIYVRVNPALREPANVRNGIVGDIETAQGGAWCFLRVQFKIWPGQGGLIETTFRQHLVSAMKAFDPQYADWQVAVTYRAVSDAEARASRTPPSGAGRNGEACVNWVSPVSPLVCAYACIRRGWPAQYGHLDKLSRTV